MEELICSVGIGIVIALLVIILFKLHQIHRDMVKISHELVEERQSKHWLYQFVMDNFKAAKMR